MGEVTASASICAMPPCARSRAWLMPACLSRFSCTMRLAPEMRSEACGEYRRDIGEI